MNFITIKEIRDEIKRMKSLSKSALKDDESLHSYEDDLRETVLKTIAHDENISLETAREMCKEVLKSSKLDFARWCA